MQNNKVTTEQISKTEDGRHYWQKRNEVMKYNSNCKAWINSDGYLEADSYNWWNILHNKNGVYFFNWYSYSSSTSKQQHKIRRLMNQLNLDYISVSYSGHGYVNSNGMVVDGGAYYRNTLQHVSIAQILQDKIDQLYTGENALSLSRATKYSVYSEGSFNSILDDIKTIAAAMKLPESKLDKMLVDAETKATELMLNKLLDDHTRRETMKQLRKENESLEAIQL